MENQILTHMIYSEARTGPLKLYIYGADGKHTGGIWFEKEPRYPDEEITLEAARERFNAAMVLRHEVRICNGCDHLVLHAKAGRMIHPATAAEFWDSLAAMSSSTWA